MGWHSPFNKSNTHVQSKCSDHRQNILHRKEWKSFIDIDFHVWELNERAAYLEETISQLRAEMLVL